MIQKDIFFSYSRKDKERIRPIVRALESQGWTVWWDIEILPGDKFDDVIEDVLKNVQCVIVAWSENSIHRDWVKDEASEGKNKNILVPILIDDVEIPLGFRRIQSANLVQWNGDVKLEEFQKLIVAISRFTGDKKTTKSSGQAPVKATSTTPLAITPIPQPSSVRVASSTATLPGIIVDSGALNAMMKGANLYPVGVLDSIGNFPLWSKVALYDQNHVLIAEGIAQYASNEINKVKGKRSTQIMQILGVYRGDAIVMVSTVSWKARKSQDAVSSPGILVDIGAIKAMRAGSNLLPVGVIDVIGQFDVGAAIDIFDSKQNLVARAISEYSSREIRKIMGRHSNTIMSSLGSYRGDMIVQNQSILWK